MKKNFDLWVYSHPTLKKLIMELKIAFFIIVISVSNVFATPTYSQVAKVSLNMENKSLEQVMDEIEHQTEFYFIFNQKQIDVNRVVNIDAENELITDVLPELFTGTNVNYVILDRKILLTTDPLENELLSIASGTESQQNRVTGIVTEKDGTPLPGVNVVVTGTTQGTITDIAGKYSIEVPQGAKSLIFSFVGMEPQEITIGTLTQINVTLVESAIGLKEVLVVGYGTQKKVTSTGAIASALGNDIKTSPTTNVTNNLAGRIPGLTSVTRSGQPGADASTLLIRGSNTLGNNSPLVVVDGIAGRDFARLNPEDIESITVLKDASAAIYGAQAANGVILVTTKRGEMGKTKISLNVGGGANQPTRIPNMADAATYATMMNEHLYYVDPSKGRNQKYSNDDITKYRDGSDPWGHPNTDWFAAALKQWSKQDNADLTITGGSEALKYYVSGATKFTDAYYKNSANNYEQYNFRSNLDGKINEYITVSVDVAASQEVYNNPGYGGGVGGVWRSLLRGIPTRPAYYPSGEPGPDLEFGDQPVVTTTDATGYNKSVWDRLETNARIVVKVPWVEGLSIQGNASYDKNVNLSKQFQKPWYLYSWDGNADHILSGPNIKGISSAQLTESTTNQHTATMNVFATYEHIFLKTHTMRVMLGTERQSGFSDYFTAFRRNYISTAIDQLFAGASDKYMTNNGLASQSKRANYFGRINYDYNKKYLLEALFRYDGSYIFAPGKRFGFFPGISAGWRISEENFWKDNIQFFNDVKLRASWGQTGNDRIAEYQYLSSYGFMSQVYTFGLANDEKMIYELRVPNPNITWEVANQANIGFDVLLFNNKLSVSADYFNNIRSQILIQRNASVPNSAGLTLPPENIGKVQNRGFEGVIGYHSQAGDFEYNLSVNGSYSKNKIVFWDETPGIPEYQQSTGKPMGSALYYQAIGIFKDQAAVDAYPHWAGAQPGDVIFKDVNLDGKIDGLDRVMDEHNSVPRFTGGLNISLKYKNFDLAILFQGAMGAKMYIKPESGILGNYYQEFADNRWTPENTNASYPRTFDGDTYYWRSQANTFWLRSSDYIRLKSMELGYNLPLRRKMGIEALRLYLNGSNLLTLDKAKIVDPESDPSGLGLPYPLQRVLNIGATLTF